MSFATPPARWLFRAALTVSTLLFALSFAIIGLAESALADDGLPPDAVDAPGPEAGDVIDGSYIVVMKDPPGSNVAANRRSAVATLRLATQRQGGKITHNYDHAVNGFAAELTADQAAALRSNPAVAYVEPDLVMSTQAEQVDPVWGLDRIDQRGSNLDGSYFHDRDGTGVDVYIVDTGIRATHNEFGGRVVGGYTTVFDGNGWQDCDGHGTHVAGTAGGSTYGVAKNVNLYAVRVLGCDGTGSTSDIVAGLDWIIANATGPTVVNVSIGGSASASFDAGIQRVADAGITIVVAAANENRDACTVSPSRVLDAIVVGAVMPNGARAPFSNYGTCLDLFAPGWEITSAWYFGDDEINAIDGTSMAAPHVAGVAAQYLSENPLATPAQVSAAIVDGATTGVVTDARVGSPNRMLYSYITSDPAPPAYPPANVVNATVGPVARMAEGAGQASALQVAFDNYPVSPVRIDWAVTGGTVDPATDLTQASGITFVQAPELRADLTRLIVREWVVDDALAEGDETLQLSYTVSGGAAFSSGTLDLVITDNDDVPQGTVEVIDDFETDLGWTFDPVGSNAETGNFEIGAIKASPILDGALYQLGTAISGTNALVTGRLAGAQTGAYDVDAGKTTAQRTISIPEGASIIEVSKYLAHYDNADRKDVLEIMVGDVVLVREESADETRQPAVWSKVRADISAYAGQTVVISVSAGDLGDPSLVEAAIDDIIVYSNPFSCASDAATLTWTDAGQSKYWIYKSVDGGAFNWIGRTFGTTTFTDLSPAIGAIYQVHYAGIDRVVCTTVAEPGASQLFSCASDAGALTWTDAGQSKYWIYKSVDGGAFNWIGRTLGATTFIDPSPTVGASYQVHFAGIPRVGCTITAEPAASVSFSCAATGGSLTWTDAGQSKYWVYRSIDGGASYQWIGRTLGATSFTDVASLPGDLYQVHYAGTPRVNCSTN